MSNTAQPDLETLLSHAAFVRGLARALLRGDRHVDDVVQETWLAAVSGGPTRPGQERAWLSRVVRNVAYGTLRKEGRRASRETAAAKPVIVPGTHEIAAREETRRKLLEHVLAVAEPSRSALLLRYYEGLAPRDVARSLGVPVETARTRIKRGLIELRRVLDSEHGGNRRAWMSGLAPLAGWAAPVAGGATAATGSLLAWGLILLMGLSASLLFVAGGGDPSQTAGLGIPEGPAPRLISRGWRRSEDTSPVEAGRSRIYGRVTREGHPLSARVWLSPGTAMPRGEPQWTDAAGHFAYDGLAKRLYALRVETDDGVVMRSDVRLLANGQHLRRDFDVPGAGNTVHGEVTWRSGKAFEGSVRFDLPTRLQGSARRARPWLSAACEGGRFVLAGLPAGPLTLRFLVPGGPSIGRTVSFPAVGETLRVVVDEGLRIWQGTVVDEQGRPRPGLGFSTVFRGPGLWVSYPGGRTSGPLGQLTFLHPADPQGGVWCTARGYVHPQVWTQKSERIVLLAGGRLHGVVRGPGGNPVGAGIAVRAVSKGSGSGHGGAFARPAYAFNNSSTVTDEEGRYSVALHPGRVFAYAAGHGLASAGVGALRRDAAVAFAKDLAPGEDLALDLHLLPSASLRGRVVDPQGQPVEGALVSLARRQTGKTHRGAGLLQAYVASDADGRFRLDVHPGFEVRARARHPEFVPSKSAAFSLGSGTEAAITLRIERPRRVRIRVVDAESGEPIVGAVVEVSRAKTWPWEFELDRESATSGADGVAELPCAPGGLGFKVRAQGYEQDANWKPLQASIQGGPFETRVTLRRGLRVAGRVLLPNGSPALNARVVFKPIAGTGGGWSPNGGGVDAEGRFVIKDKRRGTYRLTAWLHQGGTRYRAEEVITASCDALELTVRPHERQKGEWCVHVRDGDGRPVVASVVLHASLGAGRGGQFSHGVLTTDGVAYVGGLGGLRNLLAVKPSVQSGLGSALLGPFSSWEGGEYEVILSPGRVVEGVVTSADGTPAASLRLTAVPDVDDPHARVPPAVSRVARTDAQGRFTLRGLGRHPTRIRFQQQADGWTPPGIALEPDDDQPRLVLAEHHEAVSIHVHDPAGRPAVRARIEVFPATGPVKVIASATTGGDGVARLQGLHPSRTYRLLVAGDWSSHLAPRIDASWSPADLRVRLETALLTRGDVRTGAGRVAGRARVWRRGAFGRWRMVQEHPRMPFELYLAAGRHELVALTMDERPNAQTSAAWIQAGATDLVLPFEPGPTLWMRFEPWQAGTSGSLEIQREGKALARPLSARVMKSGTSERYRLESDARYSVFARFGEDYDHPDTYVYATGVVASADELVLEVKPGHTLEGRLTGGAGKDYDALTVFVHVGLHSLWIRVQPDGSFRVTGLPPGEVRVEIRRGPGTDAESSSFRCRPGVFASLRLD